MAATSLETLNLKPLASAATEPPVTRCLSGPQLLAFRETPLVLDLPATSVAVERGVKDVTEVATLCTDSLERDGAVFQKVASRKIYPLEGRNRTFGP
jgi:hypothetical protein